MKTKTFLFGLFLMFFGILPAQNRTTVTATNTDISDNLDLRAVASIFGESRDLADFERRLNDPKEQISNLDLNGDGQVDYIRVIEKTDDGVHVVILQAILDKDIYQDIATIEVERDGDNPVQVQVVGDPYIYGPNYIYEPVYVVRPVVFDVFWVPGYRPYYSSWYWGYYPVYWHYWQPYPIYRYRTHIHTHINVHNSYHYVTVRRSQRAVVLSGNTRGNGYERLHPNQSFRQRNPQAENLHQLNSVRRNEVHSNPVRNNSGTRQATGTRGTGSGNPSVRTETPRANPVRTKTDASQRDQIRSESATPREPRQVQPTRVDMPRQSRDENVVPAAPRQMQAPRVEAPRAQPQVSSPRMEMPRQSAPRMEAPRSASPQPQRSSGGNNAGSRGGGRR